MFSVAAVRHEVLYSGLVHQDLDCVLHFLVPYFVEAHSFVPFFGFAGFSLFFEEVLGVFYGVEEWIGFIFVHAGMVESGFGARVVPVVLCFPPAAISNQLVAFVEIGFDQ